MKLLTLLKSKIHKARVTGCNPDYAGSITIDEKLIDAAGLLEYEQVLVGDISNGNRFTTYVIKGGPGVIEVNGAAAKLVKKGDTLIIMSFIQLDEDKIKKHKPKIVVVDKNNQVT